MGPMLSASSYVGRTTQTPEETGPAAEADAAEADAAEAGSPAAPVDGCMGRSVDGPRMSYGLTVTVRVIRDGPIRLVASTIATYVPAATSAPLDERPFQVQPCRPAASVRSVQMVRTSVAPR